MTSKGRELDYDEVKKHSRTDLLKSANIETQTDIPVSAIDPL